MNHLTEQFIAEARKYLTSSYLPKIAQCLDELSDEDVWWRAGEESNSIGNLLLHLNGSTRMWIAGVAGNVPSERNRQQEFDEREQIPRAELIARLKQTLAETDAVLAYLTPEQMLERRQSPWGEVTVLGAVFHAVEHFSMHAGQIFMLTKMRAAKDLNLSD